jgi:drug/metabolite transporter (DMT)-like permease
MSAVALGLVLVAALLHACWNVVAKKSGGDARFAFLAALFLALLWAPLGVWAAWDVLPSWHGLEWAVLLGSAVLHVIYFTTLLRGYRRADLTVVYPVARGTGPLLSSLGALLWLGESMSVAAALGVGAVVAGVFLVAGGPGLWRHAHDPAQRERVRAGIGWGAATGVCIAGYTLIDGYAVKMLLISPILVDYVGNVFRLPFLLPSALRDRRGFREIVRMQWRSALVVAVFGPLGYVLVLYAVRLAPISHVAPAREVSLLFAALLGGRLLGEGGGSRIAGALCIAAGVAALAVG